MTTFDFHPIADLFPLLEGADFDELVADIRASKGVREPIYIYQGKILDGRNRHRAAGVAGVPCPTRTYDGDDPVGFVISLNLRRRHLSTSQRAMVAARLATLKDGQRADEVAGTSIEVAAQLLNVGRASVERAKIVQAEGEPELVKAVDAGELTVAGAADKIRRGSVTGVAMHPRAKRGLDCYETPDVATHALLKVERLTGLIWEPACGPGAIVRVLRKAGHRVVATDLADYGCPDLSGGIDFLAQQTAPAGVETILTNPPFMHANEFVRRALALAPRVVMLLRLAFLEGQGRSDVLDNGQLARVYVFRNRLPHQWLGRPANEQRVGSGLVRLEPGTPGANGAAANYVGRAMTAPSTPGGTTIDLRLAWRDRGRVSQASINFLSEISRVFGRLDQPVMITRDRASANAEDRTPTAAVNQHEKGTIK